MWSRTPFSIAPTFRPVKENTPGRGVRARSDFDTFRAPVRGLSPVPWSGCGQCVGTPLAVRRGEGFQQFNLIPDEHRGANDRYDRAYYHQARLLDLVTRIARAAAPSPRFSAENPTIRVLADLIVRGVVTHPTLIADVLSASAHLLLIGGMRMLPASDGPGSAFSGRRSTWSRSSSSQRCVCLVSPRNTSSFPAIESGRSFTSAPRPKRRGAAFQRTR